MSSSNDENSKLIKQLRLKEKYLEVINSFATILFEAQSIDEIVWAVAENAIAKLNYYDCIIYLYDEDLDRLVQKAAYGPKNPVKHDIKEPIKIKPDEGIVGTVFKSGKGEIVNDTSKDKRYIVDDARRFSEITIPLIYKGRSLGVIDSEHPDKDFFNEHDFRMLTTVAAMVSTKLVQAMATEELKRYQFNLEKMISRKTDELEKTNRELVAKNKEKEILLKEIHHRVKNNMQVIISLLNIQASTAESPHERGVLEEFKNRVRSMALVHDRLYYEEDVSSIAIDEYIMELSTNLIDSFESIAELDFTFDIPEVRLSVDIAIPLGLIVNELMTNSMKHAFKGIAARKLSVVASIDGDYFDLNISDNGKGFDFTETQQNSFGLELVGILVHQIRGQLIHENENGTHFNIRFPMEFQ